MSEGKAFNTLLLSEKSVMRLIVVVKMEILQDYEANWHYAFIVFIPLWHQYDKVLPMDWKISDSPKNIEDKQLR